MAEKICPSCGRFLDSGPTCPHCGAYPDKVFAARKAAGDAAITAARDETARRGRLRTRVILGVWGALAVLGLGLYAYDPNDTDGGMYQAKRECEKMVTQRLAVPQGAVFSPGTETSASSPEPGVWNIRGHVNSQNRLGVTLRSEYVCSVRHMGGRTWKSEGLVVL